MLISRFNLIPATQLAVFNIKESKAENFLLSLVTPIYRTKRKWSIFLLAETENYVNLDVV